MFSPRPKAAILIAFVSFSLAASAEPPPSPPLDLLSLVPQRVESVAFIRSVPALREKLKASPFQRFYADSRASGFFKPLRKNLETRSRELAAILGGTSDTIADSITGGLLVASIPPPKDSKSTETGFLVIYQTKGDAAAAPPLPTAKPGIQVRRVRAKVGSLEYDRILSTREILEEIKGGKKGSERKKSREPGAPSALPLVKKQVTTEEQRYAAGGLVILSGGAGDPMREALTRLQSPGGPSLANLDRRQKAAEALGSPHDLEVYTDLFTLTEGGSKLLDESLLGGEVNKEKLGLGEIKSVALGLSFLPDRMKADLGLYVPEPRKGMGKLLFMNVPFNAGGAGNAAGAGPESAATGNPVFNLLPPDALGYTAYSGALGEVWTEFRRILKEGAPRLGAIIDVYFKAFEQSSDVNLESSLFKNLGSHWIAFSRSGPPVQGKPVPETTFAVEVRNSDKLRPALAKWLSEVAEAMNFHVEEGKIHGHLSFKLAGAEASEGAFLALQQLSNVCLADGWLYFSSRPENIEASLVQVEKPAPGLNKTKDFAQVMKELPQDRFFEAYIAPGGYGSFFQSPMLKIFSGLMGGAGNSIVDLEAAPPSDVWRDYFGPASGAAYSTEDAMMASFFMLYAPRKDPAH